LLTAGEQGINVLLDYQKELLGPLAWRVGREG